MDSVPYAISPDPDSDVVVVEHAAGASTDQHITVHDPPSCVVVQETSIAGPSALEGSTIRDVMTEQQLHTQQGLGPIAASRTCVFRPCADCVLSGCYTI